MAGFRRCVVRFLLACVLVAAQQQAFAHAFEHLHAGVAGSALPASDGDAPPAPGCGFDAALAQLLAVATPAVALPAAERGGGILAAAASATYCAAPLGALSRGPPVLR